jgi:Flp pilus assembly protein TadB
VQAALRQAETRDPKSLLTQEWANSRNGHRATPAKTRKGKIMPLIQLLEVLIVVGVLLWLVNRFIPMQGSIKSILNGVVVIAVVLWLLNVFGMFHSLSNIHVGKG